LTGIFAAAFSLDVKPIFVVDGTEFHRLLFGHQQTHAAQKEFAAIRQSEGLTFGKRVSPFTSTLFSLVVRDGKADALFTPKMTSALYSG
jgi:hypothetical protein